MVRTNFLTYLNCYGNNLFTGKIMLIFRNGLCGVTLHDIVFCLKQFVLVVINKMFNI